MPRNVRNWWVEVEIDGRKSRFAGGPQAKGGGFWLVIRQRDKGEIVVACEIEGKVGTDGKLALVIEPRGATEHRVESVR